MSFQEKHRWVLLGVTVVTVLAYIAIILWRARGIPITEVSYAWPMIGAIGFMIVATIVGSIIAAVVAASAGEKKFDPDERDASIHRHGEVIAYTAYSIGNIVALGLTMAEAAHFWIGNSLYLSSVVALLIGTSVKLAAYRRGFSPW